MHVIIVLGAALVIVCAAGMAVWTLLVRVQQSSGWTSAIGLAIAILGVLLYYWRTSLRKIIAAQSKRGEASRARERGDFAEAEKILLDELQSPESIQSGSARATLHWDLSCLYRELERWDDAIEQLRLALTAAQGADAPFGRQIRQMAPGLLVQLFAKQERWKESEEFLAPLAERSHGQEKATWMQELAVAVLNQERREEAIRILMEAAELRALVPDDGQHLYVRALRMAGAIAVVSDQPTAAREAFGKILEHLPEDDTQDWKATALSGLAQAEAGARNWAESFKHHEECLQLVESYANEEMAGDCLYGMAVALLELGRVEEAQARATQALDIFDGFQDEKADAVQELLRKLAGAPPL